MSQSVELFTQETTSLLFLITFLLLFLPLIYLAKKHLFKASTFSKSSPPLPPGPYPWPILGNIPHLGKEPMYVTLARFAKAYGSDLISVRLGAQLAVVGSSPAAAMEILKTHDRTLSGRYVPHGVPAKDPELNGFSLGWAFECNDSWKSLRAFCRAKMFSGKAVRSQASIRERKVADMLAFIGQMEDKAVKIRDVCFASLINAMSNVLVSRDFVNLEVEYESGKGFTRELFELGAIPNIADLYPILGPLDLQNLRKKSTKMFEKFCEIWDPIVKERKEIVRKSKNNDDASSSRPQVDFLDAMIENGSPDGQINTLILEFLMAGTDSSSSIVEWLMAELIKNPECMKILQAELSREIAEGAVLESDLDKLNYLKCCFKECLRLHPPAPFLIPHRAVETCHVMGYTIPKDSQVLVNVWAIGRDPNYWEEPLEFKPERFLNTNVDFIGNDFELLPFGAGRRLCPGLALASKQVLLFVASLVHSFDWSLPHGMSPKDLDMAEKYDVAILKKERLLLIPSIKARTYIKQINEDY